MDTGKAQDPSYAAGHGSIVSYKTRSSRRSARACLVCRLRKVRCDVVERHPCGNCKWSKSECIIPPRGYGRRFISEIAKSSGFIPYTPDQPEDAPLSNGHSKADDEPLVSSPEVQNQGPPSPTAYMNTAPSWTDLDEVSPPVPTMPDVYPSVHLESFIKPLQPEMPLHDIASLMSRGALTLPSVDLQSALLQAYFEYTHPYMPILDIASFTKIVGARDGRHGRISLLLYQAVLFAGTTHVPMEHLERAGYSSRKHARRELFRRARLIYDSNSETDCIVLVQSAILMTLYYEPTEGHRNVWYWKEVAVSQAFAAGLHLETEDPGLPNSSRSLRRKIWWSCYVRDRVISLMVKRPPRIRGDEFWVPMLEDDDFEIAWPEEHYNRPPEEVCPYVGDKEKHEEFGKLFIALMRLCQHMDPYLTSSSILDPVGTQNVSCQSSIAFGRNANRASTFEASFASLSQSLKTWQNTLPECCKYHSPSDLVRSTKSRIVVQRVALHLFYQSMLLSLHWSSCSILAQSCTSSLTQDDSTTCMQAAAFRISCMVGEVHQIGLDYLIPTTALIAVIPAAAVHLRFLRGYVPADKARTYRGLQKCLDVLEILQDDYEPAKVAKEAMDLTFDQLPGQEVEGQSGNCGKADTTTPSDIPQNDHETCRDTSMGCDKAPTSPLSAENPSFSEIQGLDLQIDDFISPQLWDVAYDDSWSRSGMEGLSAISDLREALWVDVSSHL